MNIMDKIEEIRQKPEHIRMRYVWLSVAIVMAFIILVWVFSLKAEFGKERNNINLPQIPAVPALPEKGSAGAITPPDNEGFNTNLGNTIDLNAGNQIDNGQ